jgi:hypothetical protein
MSIGMELRVCAGARVFLDGRQFFWHGNPVLVLARIKKNAPDLVTSG